jgi:hypothetical protein
MGKFREFYKKKMAMNCEDMTSIDGINDFYDYIDRKNKGKGDSAEVSCGQDGSYNELKNIYNSKLKNLVDLEKIPEKQAIIALCKACKELKKPRNREEFYKCLEDELGIIFEGEKK